MNKKISAFLFTIIFLLIIGIAGFFSASNLMNQYINDIASDNEWTDKAGNKLESDIGSSFFAKYVFVDLNGFLRNLFGQREMNGIIKLNNGYLITPMEECPEDDLKIFTERTSEFNEYLKRRGTPLLYVNTPYTTGKFDPELPVGTVDHSNDNADRLLTMFEDAGIETLDIREVMKADGLSHYDMMYKTDHHWTTEAGFYTAGIIQNYIAEKTGCEIDPRVSDQNSYTFTKYENWHIGARGLRTGKYFTGVDDFTLITPNFETEIQNPYGEIGNIQRFFQKTELLDKPGDPSRYVYDTVLGGPAFLGHYKNLKSVNDVKVLILGDSYAKAVNPYLIMQFSEVNCLYNDFVGGITPKVIEEYDPDVVVMLYYPEHINKNSGSYDFRGY